jgi:hypothetical protein
MNDVLGEFTKTKEMALAWAFRGVLALLVATGSTLMWMAWGELQDVKTDLKHNAKIQWQAITTLTNNQNQAAAASAVMATTLSDHIKQEAQIVDDLHSEVKDHETRIRALEGERPAH